MKAPPKQNYTLRLPPDLIEQIRLRGSRWAEQALADRVRRDIEREE